MAMADEDKVEEENLEEEPAEEEEEEQYVPVLEQKVKLR